MPIAIDNDYRLYSLVAGLYLSKIQCGIQTAHLVSEMSLHRDEVYNEWASQDKTIIVLNALNHAIVSETHAQLEQLGSVLGLPTGIFCEDEVSMNNMATATGIIVPAMLHQAELLKTPDGVEVAVLRTEQADYVYPEESPEHQLVRLLKRFKLV